MLFSIDTKYIKRALPYLPWALLSLAGVLTVYSVLGFWQAFSLVPHTSQVSSTATAPRANQEINIDALFGKAPSFMKVAEGLMLRGIFTSTTPETGSAIIAERGKQPKLYIVGDRLPDGATLVAVHDEQVVLEKAGEQSMLLMPSTRL